MRKATRIERILSDMHDLAISVARGNEQIVAARFDRDDDLIIVTKDSHESYDWTIGFGDDEDEE